MGLFDPVDQTIWAVQNLSATQNASGDVGYISTERDLTDANFPERRVELAHLIDRLDAAGAREIYIDGVFSQPTSEDADSTLNSSLRNFSGEAYLAQRVFESISLQIETKRSVPQIAEGIPEVASDKITNFLGFDWEGTYQVNTVDGMKPSIAAQVAGVEPTETNSFPINYSFDLSTIPSMSFAQARRNDADLSRFEGTVVIIEASQVEGFSIPGVRDVPSVLAHVFAAESLKAGHTRFVPGIFAAGILALLVLLAGLVAEKTIRRALYASLIVALIGFSAFSAVLGWRMGFADALAFAGIFAIFRLRTVWKESFALVDLETNLPSFAALETDRDVSETVPAIIVAKIHRFEQVRRSLPKDLHAEYMLRITNRLKAATQDATIYLGQGHLIAWVMHEKDPALLREHLEGLRALFSAPLLVADQQVDVGISFGVDISPSPNVARRLASAVEVAEKTNETYEPIAIADTASDDDLIWNISLQARIDAALSNGEIYLAYQPKVMVQTGEIIGVEALVRWKDPVKGHIPPDNFIRQCETAGRMTQLTRFVLQEACKAGNAFEDKGLNLPIAVNISATLVHEHQIVTMVSDVLDETGFDPRRLTLEITETYRISNIDRAAEVLTSLRQLGPKISMDDFGVGAASLEALLRLPFSELKIDRLFVSQITTSAKAEGIVRSILQMGKDLRIIVVAEGVEDSGTLTLLRDSGCLVAQGFGISRPVDFDRIIKFQIDNPKTLLQNMV
ncbi:EAL domain-containing protein [Aurantiacibacter sediminis]|uniref:EAL domain-containing protein n=1 Tax=Aurantiacibacter sediminis TaxID=2793064 RepID=A0ABS0MZA5_9SPHN|nr:EAL domain-containing protein [Aurantiacibacter sediminis]MBH5321047.1 EAL domain-containing protein [Aurantiacibacter sediminis]